MQHKHRLAAWSLWGAGLIATLAEWTVVAIPLLLAAAAVTYLNGDDDTDDENGDRDDWVGGPA